MRSSGLTQHIEACKGLDHYERINISAKRVREDDPKVNFRERDNEQKRLHDALHSNCSSKLSISLKKRKFGFDSVAEKDEYTSSSSESDSSSSESDDGDYSGFNNNNNSTCNFDSDNDSYSRFNNNNNSTCNFDSDDDSCDDAQSTFTSNFNTKYDSSKRPQRESGQPYQKRAGVPPSTKFSIELNNILGRHRTDLKLHDEIVGLVKKHSNDNKLKFNSSSLKKRKGLINHLEDVFESTKLRPIDKTVKLSNDIKTTVSVFNVESMIMSLLMDDDLMRPENLAEGYDLHTGIPTESPTHFGEVHTGDAWETARKFYCGDHPQNMPIALILFGDKSHFDLHGSLSTTPLIFTLSCFNEKARNSVKFWRPIAYIPNLCHGKVVHASSTKERSADNVQDEHWCLDAALEQLIQITERGGIAMTLKGKSVIGKVWIHYVIGDTVGNNTWMGHYNSCNCRRKYRDCDCEDMTKSNPDCRYITLKEYRESIHKMNQAKYKKDWEEESKRTSTHKIDNAFTKRGIPVSDQTHGIFKMFPPELLHTTHEGITEYMLKVLKDKLPNNSKQSLDDLHKHFHNTMSHNSERDIPKGASRSSLLQDTKIGAMERRGNLFILLCVMHTSEAKNNVWPDLEEIGIDPTRMIECIQLYLSMEEWFHETNPIEEVRNARPIIGRCVTNIKEVFQRDKNGWDLSKVHGLTKMQHYMCLFGSGINFFGGPGECNHKKFVKDMANNTQCRLDSFTSQVARRYYESMLFDIAMKQVHRRDEQKFHCIGIKEAAAEEMTLDGKYVLEVKGMNDEGMYTTHMCKWMHNNNKKMTCKVHDDYVHTLAKHAHEQGWRSGFTVAGYTCLKIMCGEVGEQIDTKFRCSQTYQGGKPWYDWCLVSYNKNELYPAQILGIFKYKTDGIVADDEDKYYACVHSSETRVTMKQFRKDFMLQFTMGEKHQPYKNLSASNLTIVPVKSIYMPLFVYANSGGSIHEFFCSLPRREWCQYFSRNIKY